MNAAVRALADSVVGEHGLFSIMGNRELLWVILLGFAVFTSGLAVVYSKDLNRRLYVQFETAVAQQEELNTEWGQLLLEQSTWSMQGRVEQVARVQLKMSLPQPQNTQMVQLG